MIDKKTMQSTNRVNQWYDSLTTDCSALPQEQSLVNLISKDLNIHPFVVHNVCLHAFVDGVSIDLREFLNI